MAERSVRQYGKNLNREWGVGARHALYEKNGTWYHQLTSFPGALIDAHGYLLFATEEEYRHCQFLRIRQDVWVPTGIAQIPGYVRILPSPDVPSSQTELTEQTNPNRIIIDVERQDLHDEAIDLAIREDRLRIGVVPTDSEVALARQRRGQERLRRLTLLNYDAMCALCDISDPSLLIASHIVGWAKAPEARGMLSNVICLCRFHDVLFEQGYWSLADDCTVLRKPRQRSRTIALLLDSSLQFRRPHEHPPAPGFLHQHRLRCGLSTQEDST